MVGNIACFQGCSNSVIGQCPGYKKSCGRFYCQIHSVEELCNECGKKKIHDKMKELENKRIEIENRRRRSNYIEAARTLRKQEPVLIPSLLVFIVTVSSTAAFVSGAAVLLGNDFVSFSVSFIISLIVLIYSIKGAKIMKMKYQELIANAEKSRPGFRSFLDEYEEKMDEETLDRLFSAVGAIAGIAGPVIGAGIRGGLKTSMVPPDYTSADLSRINNKLDDIKKKID